MLINIIYKHHQQLYKYQVPLASPAELDINFCNTHASSKIALLPVLYHAVHSVACCTHVQNGPKTVHYVLTQ